MSKPLQIAPLAPAIAFLVPVLVSLHYTFVANHYERGLVWDSAHYVLSSQSLLQWMNGCLHHHYVSPATIDLGPSLMVDGPVLPVFGAIMIMFGHLLHTPDEVAILTGQSFVLGLNSLLLYWLARRLFTPIRALAAALIFGLFPSSIVSASQFLTEQLTATALIGMTLTLSLAVPRGRLNTTDPPTPFQYAMWVLLGIFALLVLHLKTALFPTVAVLFFIALATRNGSIKRKGKLLACAAAGFFACIIPWLIFSKLASGRISLAPNRVPSINLAVGMDLESDAWGVAPPTESVLPVIFDKPNVIAATLWRAAPVNMTSLFLRKIERLFAYSWNDFCWPVWGLTIAGQCIVQRLLLAASALGLMVILLRDRFLQNTFSTMGNRDLIKLAILVVVAGHFIFVPFETQPRYGYSALPYLILLAVASRANWRGKRILATCYWLFSLIFIILCWGKVVGPLAGVFPSIEAALVARNFLLAIFFSLAAAVVWIFAGKPWRSAVTAGLCSCIAFYIFLDMRDNNTPPPEWCAKLPPNTSVERRINIAPELSGSWKNNMQIPGSWAAVLVDGEADIAGATIAVDGQKLDGTAQPVLDIEQSYAFQQTIRELEKVAARTRGQEESALRQWRILPVPPGSLHLDAQPIEISLKTGTAPATIYGQYRYLGDSDDRLNLPSLYGFSALRLSILGDGRTIDRLRRRQALSSSSINGSGGDLAPSAAGKQSGEYRLYLVLSCPQKAAQSGTAPPSLKEHFTQIF